jgi:hypothetical protein
MGLSPLDFSGIVVRVASVNSRTPATETVMTPSGPAFSKVGHELDLLADRHAIVADERPSPALLDDDTLGLREERDAECIGQGRGPGEDFLPAG